jgi:putative ABC transport system permease protein
VIWLAARELVARPLATCLTALGMLTATVGFVLLASTARTTEAHLTAEVRQAWRGPYHLLVRPSDARAALEVERGLVRPNYVSGLRGGITLAQVEAIRSTPGVEVAAPLAIVGFVQWPGGLPVEVFPLAGEFGVLRLSASAVGEAGNSRYGLGQPMYAVVSSSGDFDVREGTLRVGDARVTCDAARRIQCVGRPSAPNATTSVRVAFPQPLLIAGIDPESEARLVGLDRCVTHGRYLSGSDALQSEALPNTPDRQTLVPVLLSERSFIDETVTVEVDRAEEPSRVLAGVRPEDLTRWTRVETRTVSADQLHRDFIAVIASSRFYNPSPLWSPGDVRYEIRSEVHLAATPVPADLAVFANPLVVGVPAEGLAPPEAQDVWFRTISARPQSRRAEVPNGWLPIGTYDPSCIGGFHPLAGGYLETYSLPEVTLPDGRRLGPTRSIAGYVNTPPLILTNLDGAAWFADPGRFENAPGEAFVSSVRVRLSGVEQPGSIAEARLARAAAAIHEATGLAVDVILGSSPRNVQVDLPAGRFGRPELRVTENWSLKGVAFRFVQAIRAQDLALFALMLPAATILVGQTAYVSVRRRRREFGMLRAVGWLPRTLTGLVLLEMLLLGGAVGVLALLVGVPLALALGLGATLWQLVAVVPLAVLIALCGAALPAVTAGRATPGRTLAPPISDVRRSRAPGSVAGLGLRELVHWRIESILGASALTIGTAILGGVLLVILGFRGQVDVTLLGGHLAGQVRPFHLVLAALTFVVGTLAAGGVVTLSYLERQEQLAALRALGWARRDVVLLIGVQALALGLLGGGAGSLLVLAAAALSGAPAQSAATAALLPWAGAAASALLGALGPLVQAYRLAPGIALKGE